MARQVKVYGPAAPALEDELLLAKLIQNAKARGLKWTRDAFFRDARGKDIDITVVPDIGARCCAIGAARLETDTRVEAAPYYSAIIEGNDSLMPDWYYDDGYEVVGVAFKKAMR